MSVTNEDPNADWELGDAITIRVEPTDDDTEPESAEGDAAAADDDA